MNKWLAGIGLTIFITLAASWQVHLWNECRETNSWGYCMRVLSK